MNVTLEDIQVADLIVWRVRDCILRESLPWKGQRNVGGRDNMVCNGLESQWLGSVEGNFLSLKQRTGIRMEKHCIGPCKPEKSGPHSKEGNWRVWSIKVRWLVYVLKRQLYSLGLEKRALRLGTQVKRMVQLSSCATVHRSLAGAQTKFQKSQEKTLPWWSSS